MKNLEITSYEFKAGKAGPHLLVFGAIHGNEKCGTEAIERIIAGLQFGKLKLLKGRVTLIPVANPAAYAKNVRYVEENLNRIFKTSLKPRSIEAKLANVLCPFIDRCDVFLDIHSTTAKGRPFIYLDFPTVNNRCFAKSLGPTIAITGWPQLYKKQDKKHQSFDTTSYAALMGKDCLLIECGQHKEAAAPRTAQLAILNTLRLYGLIKGKPKAKKLTEVCMSAVYFRENAKDRLAKASWKHLDKVRKGQPLIVKANGTFVASPYDAFIVMPKATAKVGDDWLYLGKLAQKAGH